MGGVLDLEPAATAATIAAVWLVLLVLCFLPALVRLYTAHPLKRSLVLQLGGAMLVAAPPILFLAYSLLLIYALPASETVRELPYSLVWVGLAAVEWLIILAALALRLAPPDVPPAGRARQLFRVVQVTLLLVPLVAIPLWRWLLRGYFPLLLVACLTFVSYGLCWLLVYYSANRYTGKAGCVTVSAIITSIVLVLASGVVSLLFW
jgi:hypothetical protein